MSTEKILTFEDVDAHIQQLHTPEKLASLTVAAAPDLCSVYAIVRPILVLISQVVLIPQTWRNYVKVLITALDALCPQN